MKPLCCAMVCGLVLLLQTGASFACFSVPAPSKTLTNIYGWRFHPTLRYWRMHRGDDFRAPLKTQLVAVQNGTVQVSSSVSGGNEIRIVGANGTVVRYLHLTKALVAPGTQVAAGQPVALSGNTGHDSASPHLHLEVYQGGHDVNPEPLFCGGVQRTPTAASSGGFPIQACKPVAGNGQQCSSDNKPIRPSGEASSGGYEQNGAEQLPPAPNMTAFDDMSTMEILSSEVSKRYANPDWYKETAERSAIPLIIDYLHMGALSLSLNLQRRQIFSRIETLMATSLARRNIAEMQAKLDRQRKAAAGAGRN